MKLTVKATAKQVRKEMFASNADVAFKKFRHNQTDYDFKWKNVAKTAAAYSALVAAVVEAALAFNLGDDFNQVVMAWAASKA